VLAILGGLGAALAWTATTITAARASRLIDVRSLLASVMTVGLVIAGPMAVIAGVPKALDAGSGAWLIGAGCANIAGLLCTYSALRIGKVGLVAPITSTEGAVAAVIAVIAGESLSAGSGLTLAAITCGVVLSARTPAEGDERRSDLRAVAFAAGAALSFGFGLYSTARVGATLGIPWAVLPPRVVGVAVIAVPLALSRRWRMTRAAVPYVVAGGLFEVLGFASYVVGARHGLAVSAVLASQFAGIAAVVGYLAFRERLARIQVVGVVTIVVGVSVLSVIHS
jgi:drug/metabolite transporter (DMT)-like permease